ncbi:MAG: Mut7-C RNAse domain-containing protein [Desulfovermiculus sp.]|nr:Mut7-C RNAse domain-containing protein [Desulfovermiculus sp.]
MASCTLHFHGQLPELLTTSCQNGAVHYVLTRRASIKDIVESLGPPHTEIGGISVHNQTADFNLIPQPGQDIHIHPLQPPVNPCLPSLLRPQPLPGMRFIVDVNVGKLARLLRILGLDAAFHWSWRDGHIAQMAELEERLVLSRDHGLLKRKQVQWGHLIRAQTPKEQLLEVISFFGLKPPFALFSRCLACNTPLQPVKKKDIEHRLKPKTKRYYQRFHLCPDCGRIYWQGSHHQHMQAWLQETISHIDSPFPADRRSCP